MKISEKLFHKYEYIATKYAYKIFSYENLSYEREDLVQEFRIKIYTSIKAYGRRWAKYRRGESPKPVPLKYYLEAACGNKARDFMKYIDREGYKISIQDVNYDFGREDETRISPKVNMFIINGVDLLEGLDKKKRAIFSLFLKGYNISFLAKVNSTKVSEVKQVIDDQRNYLLKEYGDSLSQKATIYARYELED